MKKSFLLVFLFCASLMLSAQNLPIKNQPVIWLRADIPGDSSGIWKNTIQNSYHGQFGNPSTQVDYGIFNFHPSFNLISQNGGIRIQNYVPQAKEKLGIYTVYQLADTLSEHILWQIRFDSLTDVNLTTQKIKNRHNYIQYSNTSSALPIINSFKQSWKRVKVDRSVCSFNLCQSNSFGFEGKLAEFIVVDKKPGRKDEEKIHTYLSLKYGIGLYRMHYRNSKDSILWNAEKDTLFKYDVVGLGRDDDLGIYQKQTAVKGGDTELAMYMDALKTLNSENETTLDDMSFLMFGHNGEGIENFEFDSTNLHGFPNLMERKWLVRPIGSNIHQKKVNMRMHYPALDSSQTLVLVINRHANNEYDTALCTVVFPDDKDPFGNYYYNNISWDNDFSGEDQFTFMHSPMDSNTQQNSGNSGSIEYHEEDQTLRYKLYPNPSNGDFRIEISTNSKEQIQMHILDITGKLVLQDEFTGALNYERMHTLQTSGSYLIHLSSSSITEKFKLIIK